MAIVNEQAKPQIKEAIRHPIDWWKGTGLPEEKIRPWEGGIQFIAETLKGFLRGFSEMKDRLFLGSGKGKIPYNWKTYHDLARITWDAVNDPPIGVYMDRKGFSERVHRWIMRFNATFSPLFILLQCFDFGLTPVQRLIQWTALAMFSDLMSTANAVSEAKIWAGITPLSDQRGVVQVYKTVGAEIGLALLGLPMIITGLRDVLGVTDYQIMIIGALVFTPVTIFGRWLPSYAKQRVDFNIKVRGEDQAQEEAERPPTLRESLAVVKHNRWFILWACIDLFRMLLPKTDYMFFYRFLMPTIHIRGKQITGELFYPIRGILFGGPGLLLQPFALQVIGRFKNKVNFMRLYTFVLMAQHAVTYFIGYGSWPRLLLIFTLEGIREVFDRWRPVADELIKFEMYDYVEWKTGLRSEGMTVSVEGIQRKLIKDNVTSVVGNAVTHWTGYKGWDYPREEQPERFIKSIWPLMHIVVAAGEAVVLAALFWFKYPHDPKEVEADLIERRELAQQMKEKAEVV